MNLKQYAITLCNSFHDENFVNTSSLLGWVSKLTTRVGLIFFLSVLISAISLLLGQDVSSHCSQSGPYHHKLEFLNTLASTPRETKSAGFSLELMWFQSSTFIISCMWFTLLATNVFHLAAGDFSQSSTTIESVHNLTLLKLIFKALEVVWYMSASNMAAQSSNRGRDSLFRGATLDLEQSNLLVMFPWTWSSILSNLCLLTTNLSIWMLLMMGSLCCRLCHCSCNSVGSSLSQFILSCHNCCRYILHCMVIGLKES